MSLLVCQHILYNAKCQTELLCSCLSLADRLCLAKYFPALGHEVGTYNRLPPIRTRALEKSSKHQRTGPQNAILQGRELDADVPKWDWTLRERGTHLHLREHQEIKTDTDLNERMSHHLTGQRGIRHRRGKDPANYCVRKQLSGRHHQIPSLLQISQAPEAGRLG